MVRKPEHRRLPNSSIETSDILLPWSRNCLPLGTFAARKLWRRHHCQLISPLAHILRLIQTLYFALHTVILAERPIQGYYNVFQESNHKRCIRKLYRTLCHLRGHEVRDISLGCGLAKAHLRPRNGSDVIIGPANSVQHIVALEIGHWIRKMFKNASNYIQVYFDLTQNRWVPIRSSWIYSRSWMWLCYHKLGSLETPVKSSTESYSSRSGDPVSRRCR